jgi:hypothetical protein
MTGTFDQLLRNSDPSRLAFCLVQTAAMSSETPPYDETVAAAPACEEHAKDKTSVVFPKPPGKALPGLPPASPVILDGKLYPREDTLAGHVFPHDFDLGTCENSAESNIHCFCGVTLHAFAWPWNLTGMISPQATVTSIWQEGLHGPFQLFKQKGLMAKMPLTNGARRC